MIDLVKTLRSRAIPVQHTSMRSIYERILRGIHYRHEFARRHPDVAAETLRLLDVLGLKPESVPAYETPDGESLPNVIAKAYRRTQKTAKGNRAKVMLAEFFTNYGVLPVAPRGTPFFGDRYRLTTIEGNPVRKLGEADHLWTKHVWNHLVAYETFAIAEFSLPRPIIMPALILPVAHTRTARVSLGTLIPPSNRSFAMYVNPSHTDEVLDAYMNAMIEQAREGELLGNREGHVYASKRNDAKDYERYLDILDVKDACGRVVPAADKKRFCLRNRNNVDVESMDFDDYFKRNFEAARKCRDDWRLIL